MNREIKVALFLLVCLVGLIGYFELKKTPNIEPEEIIGIETETETENIESELEINDPVETLTSNENEPETLEKTEAEIVVDSTATTEVEEKDVVSEAIVEESITESLISENDNPKNETPKTNVVSGIPEIIPTNYVVVKGDTLSQISQKYTGSIKYLPLIMEKNPELRVDQLYAGINIKLPTRNEVQDYKKINLTQSRTVPKGASAYIIEAGDTVNKISMKKFGDRSKVKEILNLNPNVDPRKLLIGSLLVLPQN